MNLEPSLSLSEIVRNAQQPKDSISEILNKISQIKNEGDLLKASVEITHSLLECDRVVIYSLEAESEGKIVAESVTSGFIRTLGMVIKDTCFEEQYIDKYRRGRVRRIDDIYKAGMSTCYIESLEEIDVRANVIVPLVQTNGSVYGLLVAHQCDRARQWQQSEINLMLQVASWTMTSLDRYIKERELATKLEQINNWQTSLTSITKEVHSNGNKTEILQFVADRARDFLDCDRIVVYGLQKPHYGEIVAESATESLASILGHVIKDPCFEYRYIDKYKQGRVRAIDNIYEAGMTDCYVENLAKIAVKSNLVVPITWDDGEIYGLLVAHQCFNYRHWESAEINWLKEIAFQTGLALSKVRVSQELKLMASSSGIIETARDTITIAKSNIKRIQEPIQDTSNVFREINNLGKLLEREFQTIDRTSSSQTKKEIKLVRIIIKKLLIQIVKTKNAFDIFDNKTQKIEQILEDGAVDLYSKDEEI